MLPVVVVVVLEAKAAGRTTACSHETGTVAVEDCRARLVAAAVILIELPSWCSDNEGYLLQVLCSSLVLIDSASVGTTTGTTDWEDMMCVYVCSCWRRQFVDLFSVLLLCVEKERAFVQYTHVCFIFAVELSQGVCECEM